MTDMTKQIPKDFTPNTEAADAAFDAQIKDAYGHMGPSTEAQQRMLEALQQAQAGAGVADASPEAQQQAAQAKRKGGAVAFLRRHLLPVAASVAAVLIVTFGAWGALQQNSTTNFVADQATLAEKSAPEAETLNAAPDSGYGALDSATSAAELGAKAIEDGDMAPSSYNYETNDGEFVQTADQPRSTVSSDVDTASYCRLRAMLNSGDYSLDDISYESDTRAEEVLNYFAYDYPAPQGADLFGCSAQASTCPWDSTHKLLVLGFNAAQKDASGSGSNLVFLIDVSGSMESDDKLPLLKRSFSLLAEQLGSNDRVSIVTYSGEEKVVLAGARGDERARIMSAINSLEADGSTNGEAGLKMAYNVAKDYYIDGGVNRICMATDGDLNVGITSDEELEDFVSAKRKSGIYLSVLGFGLDGYNDSALETLADNGNGQYHFIDCEAEAQRVLAHNLTKNFEPLANDVKVQVEFNPAQVSAYRLIGYEDRMLADEDYLDDTKDAGDVGARAQFTLAYELIMADGATSETGTTPPLKYQQKAAPSSTSLEWATASVRYKPAGDDKSTEQQLVVSADNCADAPSNDWRFAACVIEYVEALKNSLSGSGVKASLENVRSTLRSMQLNDERREFLELVEKTR